MSKKQTSQVLSTRPRQTNKPNKRTNLHERFRHRFHLRLKLITNYGSLISGRKGLSVEDINLNYNFDELLIFRLVGSRTFWQCMSHTESQLANWHDWLGFMCSYSGRYHGGTRKTAIFKNLREECSKDLKIRCIHFFFNWLIFRMFVMNSKFSKELKIRVTANTDSLDINRFVLIPYHKCTWFGPSNYLFTQNWSINDTQWLVKTWKPGRWSSICINVDRTAENGCKIGSAVFDIPLIFPQ